jgi:hypothetical protein
VRRDPGERQDLFAKHQEIANAATACSVDKRRRHAMRRSAADTRCPGLRDIFRALE